MTVSLSLVFAPQTDEKCTNSLRLATRKNKLRRLFRQSMTAIGFAILFLPLLSLRSHASEDLESPLRFKNELTQTFREAPGIASDIEVDVNGTIARVNVTQYFLNDTQEWQEGVYRYPLPENSAVDSLTMMIGDRRVIGFIHEKEEAKKIYEQAKKSGQAAALVEQHRTNMFKTSVANIPPRSLIAINIAYQMDISLDSYNFAFRMPMAITPRFDLISPEEMISLVSDAGQDWAKPVIEKTYLRSFAGGTNPVHLTLNLDAGFETDFVKSTTHKVKMTLNKDNTITITPKQEIIPGKQDFKLSWSPVSTNKTYSSIYTEQLGEDYYYHLMVLPPEQVVNGGDTPKRHVTYIIDTSGSMDGPSIDQARKALVKILESHKRDDLFNIIEFNSVHRKLFEYPLQATEENIAKAQKAVKELYTTGGTMMIPALQTAFAEPLTQDHLRQVVFITDGAIGYENQLAKIVRDNATTTRFFGIGIGAAPNATLMQSIAAAGRGASVFIHDTKNIISELTSLTKKMKAPVQTDMTIVMPDNITAEVIPAMLPDLLAGDPLKISIKAKSKIPSLAIHGEHNGKRAVTAFKTDTNKNVTGVSKIYARKKIEDLSLRDPMHQDPKTKTLITDLGIEHQILTKYTSFVAVDEKTLRPDLKQLHKVIYDPTLPKGWQEHRLKAQEASNLYKLHMERQRQQAESNPLKHEINLPQTATGHDLMIMIGLLLMLIFGTRSYRLYQSMNEATPHGGKIMI